MSENIGVIHEVGDYGVDFGYTELTDAEKKQLGQKEKQNDRKDK